MYWWNIENRMAVEGQREQEERYARREEIDDHIALVHIDGTVEYEDGYGLNERGDVVYYCDIYECEDCPAYGRDCDGGLK